MEKIYTVEQDGFEMCEKTTLDEARKILSIYRGSGAYYVLAIYRHNEDGSVSYFEGS